MSGGDVLHGVKSTDKHFKKFGEIYFSWINPGHTKGWKKHKKMTMGLMVPVGEVEFCFCDPSGFKLTKTIGATKHTLIVVPPGIWFKFTCLSVVPSLVVNVADMVHDPAEVLRRLPEDFNLGEF